LLGQVECDARLLPCPPDSKYPPQTGVRLAPLPNGLPTMPNPCAGVPSNAWCPSNGSGGSSLGTLKGGRSGVHDRGGVAAGALAYVRSEGSTARVVPIT
jgi:hypothetical protein